MKAKRLKIKMIVFSVISLSILHNAIGQQSGEIHKAVAAGDLNQVRVLLEADSTLLELKDKNGNTPLNLACFDPNTWNKQPGIAKYLIDNGADVNTRNNKGITPLLGICAGTGPDAGIVRQLIARGADINGKDNNGRVPLHDVVIIGNLEVARFMIEHGADVNVYDKIYSSNMLDMAISFNKNDTLAKLLIESGAKINQKDIDGNTELHLAAMRGFAGLIGLLAQKGADINAVNNNHHTALYYAAKHGYLNAADALIAAGADKSTCAESNYGKASQLTAKLSLGEAYVWYVNGGNAIKTKDHLLIFSPQALDESNEAGLANGRLNPDELAGLKIIMFTNYPARERGKLRVLGMANQLPDADWVFTSATGNENSLDISSYRLIGLNDSLYMRDVRIRTVPGVHGSAEFVAYYIEVDGVKIFYGRDHVSTNDVSEVEQYRREMDFLGKFGSIDIAFLRVRGHFGNDYGPYLYLLDKLSPKAIYLTGGEGMVSEYTKCAEFLQERNVPVKYPEGRIAGDRFHYLNN